MKKVDDDFEARKDEVLKEARKEGIIDVVSADTDSIGLETVELATKLMKKHGQKIHEAINEEREKQK